MLKCTQIEAAENTFVNGQDILFYEQEEESEDGFYYIKELQNNDRIIFGTSTTFLFRNPSEKEENEALIDWEFCQTEKFNLQEGPQKEKIKEEFEMKKKALEENEVKLKEQMKQENEKYKKLL